MVTRQKSRVVGRAWPVSLVLAAGAVWGLPRPLAPSVLAAVATIAEDAVGGMTFAKDGADIKIRSIAPGSVAANAGLKVGDYLYTVGGKKVGDLSVGEVMRLFADASGTAECVFVTGAGEKTLTVSGAGGAGPRPEPARERAPARDERGNPGVLAEPMPVTPLGNFDPVAQLLPDSKTLPPPVWAKPGTRLLFYSAAASVPQSYYTLIEDPNGPYEDKKTGKRYRRSDTKLNNNDIPPGNPGASGDGVTQIDILATDGKNVAISSMMYTIDRVSQPPKLSSTIAGGWILPGASLPGVWAHPKLLEQLTTLDIQGLKVVVGPYPLGGRTYNSISFDNEGGGNGSSYTYDLDSGLLLWSRTSVGGQQQNIFIRGEGPSTTNASLAMTAFAGMRQTNLPGRDGVNPAWVKDRPTLRYRGTYNFTNPVDPTSANQNFPMDVTVSIDTAGDRWAAYTLRSLISIAGMPRQSEVRGMCGPAGLYWVDPAGLRDLRSGQVIDEDPVMQSRSEVAEVGRAASGREVVTIVTRLPGITNGVTYDRETGVLLELAGRTESSGETIVVRLQEMPR